MKKSDGDGPFPNAQMPTMQIDAIDAQEISLEDPDVASGPSSASQPPRSRATPPPLPPELPPTSAPIASTPSVPPPSYAMATPQKKPMSMGVLVGATIGALVIGGGIVAIAVRGKAAPAPPAVSVVQTTAPAPSASTAPSSGVMTIPVIEFDDKK